MKTLLNPLTGELQVVPRIVDIDGGTIDNAAIGQSVPAAVRATQLSATGDLNIDGVARAIALFIRGVTGYGGEIVFQRDGNRTWALLQQENTNNLALFRYPTGPAIATLSLNLATGNIATGNALQAGEFSVNLASGDTSYFLLANGVRQWSLSRNASAFYVGRFSGGIFSNAPFQIDQSTGLTNILSGLAVSGGSGLTVSNTWRLGSASASLNRILVATSSGLASANIPANGSQAVNVTVTGAAVGDWVQVCPTGGVVPNPNIVFYAIVSAANTVTVTARNLNGAAGETNPNDLRVLVVG